VLQLAEQGRLRLDRPVRELLPSFHAEPQGRGDRVTVAELLNHSAGLPNNVPAVVGWMRLEDQPPLDQTRLYEDRFPAYARVEREPGTLGVYSNVDYLVLGALIEHVSGIPYEQYVTEHVLRPLGMTHTAFAYPPA
jgi:D-alanyl-D-alanine carboxypeptidase